jgi:hypothetical protein
MHTYWQCKQIFELFLEAQRLTCTDSRFNVTRPAERSACDCDAKGKQCHKGKGKE